MKLVLASNNAKKLAELRVLLGGLPLQLQAQGALGIEEADEPHASFVENALAKARHAAAAAGGPAIADDSGLCVHALAGAPGVASALAAGPVAPQADREATRRVQDRANNRWLLDRLQGVTDRRARFVSTLVALRAADDPEPLIAFGRWEGEILTTPRGEGGFGYDPLMWIAALGTSVAELSAAQKNEHSHRAIAAAQMRELMRIGWRLSSGIAVSLPGRVRLAALPPLAVYVHLPWCLKKCPYCDFNSHEVSLAPKTPAASPPRGGASGLGRPGAGLEAPKTPAVSPAGDVPETRYLDALCADLEAALPQVWGRRVHSVFIGGGTPSLFSPAGIDRLLADLRARLPLVPDCEVTLEANPGTFERERFRAYRGAGVTRLSVGVQSFDDAALQRIGRVHDAAQARAAVAEAAAAFDSFNIDLMYALPGQDLAALKADLDAALAYSPPHLSVYHLTIEPNTRFASHPPVLPDDDTAAQMLDLIAERTAAAGLQRYEVSAFARPGHRCRHNLNYWGFGDYLGLGAGAHGKLSFPDRVLRQVRWREPRRYMEQALAGQAVSNQTEVAADALPFEFMLNALRLRDGFDLSLFSERTGLPVTVLSRDLAAAEARGLIERELTHLRPTARGFDFLSDLQALFLQD